MRKEIKINDKSRDEYLEAYDEIITKIHLNILEHIKGWIDRI